MKSKFVEASFEYDGSQLRSLFGYLDHGILGDSIVSWEGPCEIPFDHMIDGEDLRDQSAIRGGRMVHFIIEFFPADLLAGVAVQRLFAALASDLLREKVQTTSVRESIRRDGDDIFVLDRKFSISIATVSPVSTLVHFAVNASNEGTPIPTSALEEWSLDSRAFAETLMARFTREFETIREATMKVKWTR